MFPITAFAVLVFAGLGLSAFAASPETEVEDVDTPDESEEGLTLAFETNATVLGGAGDDTLIEETGVRGTGDDRVYLEAVDLGDGDDFAEVRSVFGAEVLGGNGNDTLISTGLEMDIYGGAGNDILTGGSGDDVYGGDGDDVLSIQVTDRGHDSTAGVFGGAGSDTLLMENTIGWNLDSVEVWGNADGGAGFYGGDGADSFELTLQIAEYEDGEPPETLSQRGPALRDFTAQEDVLIIDVIRLEGEEGRMITSSEIVQGALSTGETYADLILTFEETDDQP